MKQAPRIPWLALGLAGALGLGGLLAWSATRGLLSLPPCPSKTLLGISCATCGGTRAAVAMWEGHLQDAFHWHPVAVVLALLTPFTMAWDLVRAWRGWPYPDLPDHLGWRLVALAAFLATWALQVARGI